ncbi:MAG TPA: hypothetical protein VJU53_07520 [Burkholderiaceae bacterium]|nr:hypothetical protein [Burkholderiaceae bacterium]
MQIDSTVQKLELLLAAAVAVVLIAGIAYVLSVPLSAPDYGVSDVTNTAQQSITGSPALQETPPALLEPALRSPDGVASHG